MYLCANLSMLFTEAPMAERVGLAAEAGFASVEVQFPEERDIDGLARASRTFATPVTLINVPRGEGNEVGLAALPGRQGDFRAAVDVCLRQALAIGVEKVNVLAGRPPVDADPEACRACLIENLRHACDLFAANGVKVMLEPINPTDVPGFFIASLEAALEVIEAVCHPDLHLQFDLYHMAITEPDLPGAIQRAGQRIGHVQFADAPGRHEPGTGGIDLAGAIHSLRGAGYDGAISAEYRPRSDTLSSLGWMDAFREAIRGPAPGGSHAH